jgi:nucleotide-binding universal stress UspA family protein
VLQAPRVGRWCNEARYEQFTGEGRRGLYSHILIGLDQSDVAQRALRRAIQIAAKFNATLTAVAVTPALPAYAAYTAAISSEALKMTQSDQEELFVELLKMARREATQHAIEIDTILISGSAVVSLLDAVRTNHVDLLVVGIHPDQGLLGWLSVGTTHRLAQGAPCDVLGVH